jgi:hypothetical protein
MPVKPHLDTTVHWLIIAFVTLVLPAPLFADNNDNSTNVQAQLKRGDVVVSLKDIGNTKYVTAQVLINAPPDQVWPIMVNPFEFQRKISPRMKTVEIVTDQSNRSVLRFTIDAILIPHFIYTVESLYDNRESIQFHSVAGMLKDCRGSWVMTPSAGGNKTELTYCMYVDPGFPVPQWMIREVVKGELPKTLTALRERVQTIFKQQAIKEKHTILAAFMPCRKTVNHSIVVENTPESLPLLKTATNGHR